MSYIIRAVDDIKYWNLGKNFDRNKLIEIDADPIFHLGGKTKENELSVFATDNISDIDHIVIAIASMRQEIEKFHCVVVDENELMREGLLIESSEGNTPVYIANKQHRNLTKLKARDLEKLARIFLKNVNKNDDKDNGFKTLNRQEVKRLIKSVIDNKNYIDKAKVVPKIIKELEKGK